MEKKITLKEFFESKEILCIHCDTEEKANDLLRAFDKMGKEWCNGESYLERNNWGIFGEEIVYYNDNMCDNTYYANEENHKIYEFEDVDLED